LGAGDRRLPAQDLVDAGDRVDDRLLGGDALGDDAMDRPWARPAPAKNHLAVPVACDREVLGS
jgi:hypothetical protein